MSILDYLVRRKQKSAVVAKERLQIILAREHLCADSPDYLPELKKDLLSVISKYANINIDDVTVNLDRDGNCEILELNIILPEVDIRSTLTTQQPIHHKLKEVEPI